MSQIGKKTKYSATKILLFMETLAILFGRSLLVRAAENNYIAFGNLDDLLNGIVGTVQHYTLPIMGIVLAFLGVKLVMSGDDTNSKTEIKSFMYRVLLGGFIIFGATTIAASLKAFILAHQ